MKKRKTGTILKLLIFIFILNNLILAGYLISKNAGSSASKTEQANITRVIDGDTIETELGKVRLLGINTPEEGQYYYQEAKNYLNLFLNQQISMEKTKEDKDQYDRLLRYVFIEGTMLNKHILELGLAHFYTYNEDKYTEQLRQAEKTAREQNLGIWRKSTDICAGCINLIELNEVDLGEYVILGNNCSFACNLAGWTINDDSSSHERKLDFSIFSGENKKLDYNGSIWNDDGDSLYLRDSYGLLVLFYRY